MSVLHRLPGGAVTALGLTQLIGWGTTFYIPAALAHVIAADTGWTLTEVFAAFSWNLLIAGLASRVIGEAIDRLGARAVMSAGSAGVVAGLLTLASATHWLQLFAAWSMLGFAARASQYDAAFAAIAAIEGHRARRAISLITLWGGLASTVFWPFGHLLAEALGWRWTIAVYAALNLLVCLPLHLSLPARSASAPAPRREPPASTPDEDRGAPAAPDDHSAQHRTPGDARDAEGSLPDKVRDRALLVFSAVLAGYSFVFSALSAHLIVLVQGLGLAAAAAVGLSSIKGVAQVGARFLELIGQRWLGPIAIGVIALGLLPLSMLIMLAAPPDPLVLATAIVIYGAANGLTTIVRGAVPLALFGHAGFGATLGRIAAPGLISAALAPLAFAWVLERAGARAGLGLLAAIGLAGLAGMLWLARRPPA